MDNKAIRNNPRRSKLNKIALKNTDNEIADLLTKGIND